MNPIKFFGPPESSIMRAGGREDFWGMKVRNEFSNVLGEYEIFFRNSVPTNLNCSDLFTTPFLMRSLMHLLKGFVRPPVSESVIM